jgi:hypothetical protein
VFARLANGNAARTRVIEGQATLLNRTMHGIVYDSIHDEIIVPHPFGEAILTFAGAAAGEVAPIRVLQGPDTELIPLDRLAADPVNNEIYVPEGEKVLVYPREANGNVRPKRVLYGPDTRLGTTRGMAIDPVRNLLVVVGGVPGQSGQSQLVVFDRTASGNAKPKRVIAGPRTGITGTWNIEIDPQRGLILLVQAGFVGVWHIDDEGDVPPRYTIGGPGVLDKPRGVAIDPKHNAVFVSDKGLNAVLTFELPELFEASRPSAAR